MKLVARFRLEEGIVGKSDYDIVAQWQNGPGRMLACADVGQDVLKFYNRQGILQQNMRVAYPIYSVCWNRDGEYLAVSFQPPQQQLQQQQQRRQQQQQTTSTNNQSSARVWIVNARSKQYNEYDLLAAIDQPPPSTSSSAASAALVVIYPKFVLWCRNQDILAVCTNRGHIFLIDHARNDIQCIQIGNSSSSSSSSKQQQQQQLGITTGDWSSSNLLAAVSEDKSVVVLDLHGNVVSTFEHTANSASSLKFPQTRSNSFALILAQKALLLCQLAAAAAEQQQQRPTTAAVGNGSVAGGGGLSGKNSKEKNLQQQQQQQQITQIRLSFDTSYGDILDFYWHQDDYLIIAFTKGYVIEVSTRANEISTELWHCQVFASHLSLFSMLSAAQVKTFAAAGSASSSTLVSSTGASSGGGIANAQHKFAACDGNFIKIFDARSAHTPSVTLQEPSETTAAAAFSSLLWSCDGDLLMAVGASGQCYLYMSSTKQLGSAYFTQFAYLSSGVGEITVADEVLYPKAHAQLSLQTEFDVSVVGMGPTMLIAAANNFVRYYQVFQPTNVIDASDTKNRSSTMPSSSSFRIEFLHTRQFYNEIVYIAANRYVAAFLLDNGKIFIHSIPPAPPPSNVSSKKPTMTNFNDDFIDKTSCVFPDSFRARSNNSTSSGSTRQHTLFEENSRIQFTCVETNSDYVAVGADDGRILLFNSMETLHVGPISRFQHTSSVVKLALHPRLPFCAVIDMVGHVALFDAYADCEIALNILSLSGSSTTTGAAGAATVPATTAAANTATTTMRARGILFNCGSASSPFYHRNAINSGSNASMPSILQQQQRQTTTNSSFALHEFQGEGNGIDCSLLVYDEREVAVVIYRFDSVDGARVIDVRLALAALQAASNNTMPSYDAISAATQQPQQGEKSKNNNNLLYKKNAVVAAAKAVPLPRSALPLAFYDSTLWLLRQDGQLLAKQLSDTLYPSDIAERVLAAVNLKDEEIVEQFPWTTNTTTTQQANSQQQQQQQQQLKEYEGRKSLLQDIRKCVAVRRERHSLRLINILLKADAAQQNSSGSTSAAAAVAATAVGAAASTAESIQPSAGSSSAAAAALSAPIQPETVQLLQAIARQCVEELEIDVAIYVYRLLKQPANVWQMDEILTSCGDERLLIKANVAMFLKRFDDAEKFYLEAEQPHAALQMRCSLLDWARASQLAREYAPDELPSICHQYGMQLEFSGDYAGALTQFERGLVENGDMQNEHNRKCYAGIARTSARINNVQRALAICAKMQDHALSLECAQQMEAANAFSEAGQLYETIQQYERAASAYLRAKDWIKLQAVLFVVPPTAASESESDAAARPATSSRRSAQQQQLLNERVPNPLIRNPQLFQAYAKRQEDANKYDEACRAYDAGGYYEDVVRIYLRDNVNKIDQAIRVVEQRRSRGAALLLASYLAKQRHDNKSALRLLLHVGCDEEAFKFAQQNSLMHVFADTVGTQASVEIYKSIAAYFEAEKNNVRAGKFFMLAGMHARAIRVILREMTTTAATTTNSAPVPKQQRSNNNNTDAALGVPAQQQDEALSILVQAAVQSREKALITQVESFLLGQLDGTVREPYFLYRLYMETNAYREAAKVATVVARNNIQESEYDRAHDLLRATCTELVQQTQQMKKEKLFFFLPLELRQLLVILHSRKLAVLHSRLGDYQLAAHLLKRIVENVSLFPAQDGEKLLWSYYTICGKAQFKLAAYEMAKRLNEMSRQKSAAATSNSGKPSSNDTAAAATTEMPEKYRNAIFQTLRRGAPQADVVDPVLNDEMCICAYAATISSIDAAANDNESTILQSHSFSPILLTCPYCKQTLPFCLFTGLRMTIDDFGVCNKCLLPVTYSKAVDFISKLSSGEYNNSGRRDTTEAAISSATAAAQRVECQCPMCRADWAAPPPRKSSNNSVASSKPPLTRLTRKQVFEYLEKTWITLPATAAVATGAGAAVTKRQQAALAGIANGQKDLTADDDADKNKQPVIYSDAGRSLQAAS